MDPRGDRLTDDDDDSDRDTRVLTETLAEGVCDGLGRDVCVSRILGSDVLLPRGVCVENNDGREDKEGRDDILGTRVANGVRDGRIPAPSKCRR